MTFIELIIDIPFFCILAVSFILAVWRIKQILEFCSEDKVSVIKSAPDTMSL